MLTAMNDCWWMNYMSGYWALRFEVLGSVPHACGSSIPLSVQSRIDISVLADLTETDQETVKLVVESLHAVLFVSPKDGCVYWYHASFLDFLFSGTRASISLLLENHRRLEFDAFCDEHTHHRVLAQRCLSVMRKSLHFNMCKSSIVIHVRLRSAWAQCFH